MTTVGDATSAAQVATELADVAYALELEPQPGFTYVSPSVEALVGYTPEEHYADPGLGMRLIDPRDLHVLQEASGADEGVTFAFRVRWLAKDGSTVWTDHRCRKVRDENGRVMLFGAARDVTELVRLEEQLGEERDRYRLLSENSLDVVYRVGTDGLITWASPSVQKALGWHPDEMVGRDVSTLIHPEDLEGVRARQSQILAAGESDGEIEMRYSTAAGGWRWMRVVGRAVRDDNGSVVGGIDELRDIQGEMDLRSAIATGLAYDGLTGVADRTMALQRIGDSITEYGDRGWSLLCAGVDGMTRVNQALTYTAGDRILVEVANRLVEAAGAPDRVARVAGDEFVILLPDVSTAADAGAAAERMLAAVRGPVRVGPHDVEVSACIGVATYLDETPEELLRDATTAMRQTGSRGTDRWDFLDGTLASVARRALTIEAELREALAGDGIHAWFQPVVTLADGKISGYEALVRWIRADGTVVPPDDFLPVASRTDLIVRIDHEVLRQTFDALARLAPPLTVAANISVATLIHGDLCDVVRAESERTGVDPSRLHLEVTETSLINVTEGVLHTMRTLDAGGITWWVDDFGTGFSSISHIRDLPIRGLKLDRLLTVGIGSGDSRDVHLAKGLAGLADGLELQTIAEGIETQAEADALVEQGWQRGQGWLYGRPAALRSHLMDEPGVPYSNA